MKKKYFIGVLLALMVAVFATNASAVVIDFAGGDATLTDGSTHYTDNSSYFSDVVSYVEDGVLVEFIGLAASWGSFIGNYYGPDNTGANNAVIHTHWINLQAVKFSMLDGSPFDLNYMDITTNTVATSGPAGTADGTEDSWITASNGAAVKMASSDWGWQDGMERVWFPPEFDGITSFTVTSTNAYCFGLDNFYINEPPPPPEEPDTDLDGIIDVEDNCPTVPNPDQADPDNDNIGDVCDSCPNDFENDADADGICGDIDNCPQIANDSQVDFDGDGMGNACDDDDDNDGVPDSTDNCQYDVNPDQADFDQDGAGDVCDADTDGDDVIDADDECLGTAVGEVVDSTGCSIDQICPCVNNWKNHGGYVRCVAHTSDDFLMLGLITGEEKDYIVSTAAQSECGHKK